MALTHDDYVRNGRKGSRVQRINNPDWAALTANARAAGPGSIEYWLRKIDPNEELQPEQRVKVAQVAKQLFYANLAEKSRRARAARKAGGQA